MAAFPLPINEFFSTGATLAADIDSVVQLAMVAPVGYLLCRSIAPYGLWSHCQVGVVSATTRTHSAQLK